MVTLLGERKRPPPSEYQSVRAFLDSMVHHDSQTAHCNLAELGTLVIFQDLGVI